MLILLVRGLTLDGASDGIRFYLEPSAEKLKDQNVRTDVTTKHCKIELLFFGVCWFFFEKRVDFFTVR